MKRSIRMPAPKELPRTFEALVQLIPPRALSDEVDYENVQEMIDRLSSLPRLTKGQAAYLDTLTILFAAYEDQHHTIDTADVRGVDALKVLVEDHGMSASDLGRLLGDRSLGSRVLRGERALSKDHIRKLCAHFKVSADLFMA